MGDRTPAPVPGDDRGAAVNVHQLRAGHSGRAESYLHRIGRRPTDTCAGCSDGDCPVPSLSLPRRSRGFVSRCVEGRGGGGKGNGGEGRGVASRGVVSRCVVGRGGEGCR